jgi:hypothetical protein
MILLLTHGGSSEMLKSVLWISMPSRWYSDNFDVRESLIPPFRPQTLMEWQKCKCKQRYSIIASQISLGG